MDRRFMIILAVLILGFGGFFVISKKSSNSNNNTSNTLVSNHVYGDGKKGVTLLEYGDFECPACGAYHTVLKQLKEQYKSDMTFQFRNFPLDSVHQNARAAHRAAEAAAKQNKFWEMHDKIYENQNSWNTASASALTKIFEDYASELSLNMDQFKSDYLSSSVNDIINADIAAGQKLNINSTPTFFLNGKKIEENPRSAEDFIKLVSDAINAAGGSSQDQTTNQTQAQPATDANKQQ